MTLEQKIESNIRNVPDFPVKGIQFKDITPVLLDPVLRDEIVDALLQSCQELQIDAVVAIESRGFFFGSQLAGKLQVPFIPARKKGKLPYRTLSVSYQLEYGEAIMEIHEDAIQKGWNVLIHDDLLATGGTAKATAELVKMASANVVVFSFLVELTFLKGREAIAGSSDAPVDSLVKYNSSGS